MRKKITFSFLVFFSTAFSLLFAQNIIVTGNVKDATGEVLAGVNIRVKGTDNGTSTDFDGNYTITTSQGDVLVFSYLGFTTKEVSVTGATLNVILKEDTNQLNEVVVTAFGIEKKTKTLGYSAQKISLEKIDMSGQINPFDALQGRVAGLVLNQTSGSASGGVDILIRGITSVDPNRDNQPLIIIDGLALNNDTFKGDVLPSSGSNASGSSEQFSFSNRGMDINPDDIASFTVLKGAAATALYGVRASNGAIIITTKKGKIGKAKVNVSSSVTVRDVVKAPELQKIFREGHRTTGRPGAITDPSQPDGYDDHGFAFYSWGPKFTADSWDYGAGVVGDLTKDRFHSPYEFFRTGVNTEVNFNISGATDKIDYYFSMGNSSDYGIVPNTNYNKTNFRFKVGNKISDKLSVQSSVSYNKSGGARGNGGDKSIYSSLSYWSSTYDINDYLLPDGSVKNYTKGIIDNPRYFAEKSNMKNNLNRWIGNMSLSWKPADWVTVVYKAQVDNYSDKRNRFVPANLDVGTHVGGFIVNENINFLGLESDLIATFTKDFSEDLNMSLSLGNQITDSKRLYDRVRGETLNIPGINTLSNTLNIFAYSSVIQNRNIGIFGDFRLAYKDKLFLSVTGRNDWLSTLPKNNRSFLYPSTSLSYLLKDDFFKDSKTITFAKLRVSWAQVGKGPGFAKVSRYFIPDPDFPFSGSGGFRINTAEGDPNLKPERDNTLELGTDFRLFNNRLRFDYSYYNTVVNDQIFTVGAAYSSGRSGITRNAGQYKTWGHELTVVGKVIDHKDFKWEAIVNWSTTGGKVTQLPADLKEIIFFGDRITAKAKEGDALGTLYGWKFQTVPTGQRYVGSDGKWVITGSNNSGFFYTGGNEMVKVGNAFPDYVLSMSNNFTWKNFTLSTLLEYKAGGDVYDRGFRNSLRNGNLKETEFRDQTRVLKGYMDDGSGGFTPNTKELMISANNYYRDWNNYNSAAEVLLQDGSWVKLRNIALTYNLPNSLLKKMKIQRASFTASAHNILIWTPFKGFDPEANQFSAGSNIYGFTGLTAPLTQSYSFGIKLQF